MIDARPYRLLNRSRQSTGRTIMPGPMEDGTIDHIYIPQCLEACDREHRTDPRVDLRHRDLA